MEIWVKVKIFTLLVLSAKIIENEMVFAFFPPALHFQLWTTFQRGSNVLSSLLGAASALSDCKFWL